MSQVNVNPGGPGYRDDGSAVAAAGINLVAVIIVAVVVIAIAVLAWGALAGNWFTSTTTTTPSSSSTSINISVPAQPANSPVLSPAPSR